MLSYPDLSHFRAALGGTRKWQHALEAIERAHRVSPEVTHSVGDLLTYRVTTRPDATRLTGHRRYLAVRHVLEGDLLFEYAAVSDLTAVDAYSDLTDRQHFAGPATRARISAGACVVADIDEALRDVEVNGRMVTLRVTVEGAFFANK